MSKWLDIKEIEKTVYTKMQAVSEHVFVNNAPVAVPERMSDYIIIDVLGEVSDKGPYKESYCYLFVYVRNRKSGVQNTVSLDAKVNAVLSMIPMVDERFSMITPRLSYGRRVGEFTQASIRCKLVINQ